LAFTPVSSCDPRTDGCLPASSISLGLQRYVLTSECFRLSECLRPVRGASKHSDERKAEPNWRSRALRVHPGSMHLAAELNLRWVRQQGEMNGWGSHHYILWSQTDALGDDALLPMLLGVRSIDRCGRCTAVYGGARSFHLVHSKWASPLRAHRPRTGCRRHRKRVGRAAILERDELGTSDRAPGRSASRLEAQPSKIPGWLTIGATSEQLHREQRVAMGLILFHPPRLDEADLGQHTQRSGVPVPDRGPQTSMP
jgi:hypothetical protein